MESVKLVLTMTSPTGETLKKTYPYINPNATDSQYRKALEGLSSMTVNTFINAQKVVTTDLEEDDES